LSLVLFFPIVGGLLFGLAGTFDYPGAWSLLASLLVVAVAMVAYYLKTDPEFLAKRSDYREKEKTQKGIIGLALLPSLSLFAVPALDRRFGWTPFSWAIIAAGLALVFIGFAFLMAVMRANRFAARTIKIQEGQRVIDSGPYALVRHPMYLAAILVYAGMPLALQSLWGLLGIPFLVAVLVLRIVDEEKILLSGLAGYGEYLKKVRWRLLPRVW
jgi:protein-S-isoprenylcysteine O-methyltransferase Ste14